MMYYRLFFFCLFFLIKHGVFHKSMSKIESELLSSLSLALLSEKYMSMTSFKFLYQPQFQMNRVTDCGSSSILVVNSEAS